MEGLPIIRKKKKMVGKTGIYCETSVSPNSCLHAIIKLITKRYHLRNVLNFRQKNQFISLKDKQNDTDISTEHFWPTRKLFNHSFAKQTFITWCKRQNNSFSVLSV